MFHSTTKLELELFCLGFNIGSVIVHTGSEITLCADCGVPYVDTSLSTKMRMECDGVNWKITGDVRVLHVRRALGKEKKFEIHVREDSKNGLDVTSMAAWLATLTTIEGLHIPKTVLRIEAEMGKSKTTPRKRKENMRKRRKRLRSSTTTAEEPLYGVPALKPVKATGKKLLSRKKTR